LILTTYLTPLVVVAFRSFVSATRLRHSLSEVVLLLLLLLLTPTRIPTSRQSSCINVRATARIVQRDSYTESRAARATYYRTHLRPVDKGWYFTAGRPAS